MVTKAEIASTIYQALCQCVRDSCGEIDYKTSLETIHDVLLIMEETLDTEARIANCGGLGIDWSDLYFD